MKKGRIIVVALLSLISGAAIEKILSGKRAEKKYQELRDRLAKFEDYFAVTNKWLKNRNHNIAVADYFKRNNYNRIAIYGMGEIGKRLCEELSIEGVSVAAVFDRSPQRLDSALNVYSLDGDIPEVDVVVVTPTFDYENIERLLRNKVSCKIISISDVIMG